MNKSKMAFSVLVAIGTRNTRDNQMASLHPISEAMGLSVTYLEALIKPLRQRQWVRTSMGPGGGYALNKPPQDITFMDVMEAVEPEFIDRIEGGEESSERAKAVFSKLSKTLREDFKAVRVSDAMPEIPSQWNRAKAKNREDRALHSKSNKKAGSLFAK